MKYFPDSLQDTVDYLMSDNFKNSNNKKLSEYITITKVD